MKDLLRRLFRRTEADEDIRQEIEAHIAMRAEMNRKSGMPADEASTAARRQFGNAASIREEIYDIHGFGFLDGLARDVYYAWRALKKRRGFVLLAVLTMGFAIGATTAVFSVVDAVILRSLPYGDSEHLVYVWSVIPKFREDPATAYIWNRFTLMYSQYKQVREHETMFRDFGVLRERTVSLIGRAEPRRVNAAFVSASLFTTLQLQPSMGRLFTTDDEMSQGDRAVVVSDAFWRSDLGSDSKALGQSIVLDTVGGRKTYTIIGMLPDDFRLTSQNDGSSGPVPEIFLPVPAAQPGFDLDFEVIARLKPGVAIADAEREIARILNDPVPSEFVKAGIDKLDSRFVPVQEQQIGPAKVPLLLVLAAAGLLLMIASCNVGNLFLGEAAKRQHEIALRAAVGASWRRITRQLITESVLVSTAGGIIGLILAVWGVRALVFPPAELPRINEIRPDVRVFGLTVLLSLVTGLIFGLMPAIGLTRLDLSNTLSKHSNRISQRRRLQAVILTAEIGLSFALLVSACLLTRSFLGISAVDPGLRPDNLVSVELAPLPISRYHDPLQIASFYKRAVLELKSLPGVKAVSAISMAPFDGGHSGGDVQIEGKQGVAGLTNPLAEQRRVLPDYFDTAGIPILQGRTFTETENENDAPVALVNRAMAQTVWPGENPIDKRIRWSGRWLVVVGVCGDVREYGLAKDAVSTWYAPAARHNDNGMATVWTFMIRASADYRQIEPAVRQTIRMLDSDLPIERLDSMNNLISESKANERYRTILISTFAAAAGFLSLIGLYGVASRFVTYRHQEWAIRLALGARTNSVLWLVMRESFVLTIVGIGIGVLGAVGARKILSQVLFGISALDFSTHALIAAGLMSVAFLATYLPARRASRIDPMVSLRSE
jgi:putative ABC transport system permease protein